MQLSSFVAIVAITAAAPVYFDSSVDVPINSTLNSDFNTNTTILSQQPLVSVDTSALQNKRIKWSTIGKTVEKGIGAVADIFNTGGGTNVVINTPGSNNTSSDDSDDSSDSGPLHWLTNLF